MKSSSESSPSPSPTNKAYPWLLFISTCLSGVLCWLYVTKPVHITAADPSLTTPEFNELVEDAASPVLVKLNSNGTASQLVPSDDNLPGITPAKGDTPARIPQPGSRKSVDPRQIINSGDGSGWEATNSRVQHILSADAGNGDLTRIVLNVPVLYQTRTMRWTPTDVQNARGILTRLMVYENNLSKVRQEGQALLIDWNQLLAKTVPTPALRADSPSLPYNHSRPASENKLPASDSSIKIEQ